MARGNPLIDRLGRRLACHQTLHDHKREPRNKLRWLPLLRSWQTRRLETSFEHFLYDPQRRAAALFFLTDVYGDRDFSKRDANVAKVDAVGPSAYVTDLSLLENRFQFQRYLRS